MPYLKQKILKALQHRQTSSFSTNEASRLMIILQGPSVMDESVKPKAAVHKKSTQLSIVASVKNDQSKPSSKNIVKNFGKAMCRFASSSLALPYLECINRDLEFCQSDFQTHMRDKMSTIDSLNSVRSLLYIDSKDTETVAIFKKVFQRMCMVFIKFFSVNWIFQGKMSHKRAHLDARFKMLRRVKNPEYFTYFREFSK